jgi:hypothetical protein
MLDETNTPVNAPVNTPVTSAAALTASSMLAQSGHTAAAEDLAALAQDPQVQAASNQFVESALAVNLDETIQPPIRVRFVEWGEVDEIGEDGAPVLDPETGQPYKVLVPRPRIAVINSFVPSFVFNQVMAIQQRAARDKTAQSFEVLADCVLLVWKLTEPRMTSERLAKGLDFEQISGLFARFFGETIRRMNSRARAGVPMNGVSR